MRALQWQGPHSAAALSLLLLDSSASSSARFCSCLDSLSVAILRWSTCSNHLLGLTEEIQNDGAKEALVRPDTPLSHLVYSSTMRAPDPLDALAAEVAELHRDARDAARVARLCELAAGNRLIEIRERMDARAWSRWMLVVRARSYRQRRALWSPLPSSTRSRRGKRRRSAPGPPGCYGPAQGGNRPETAAWGATLAVWTWTPPRRRSPRSRAGVADARVSRRCMMAAGECLAEIRASKRAAHWIKWVRSQGCPLTMRLLLRNPPRVGGKSSRRGQRSRR